MSARGERILIQHLTDPDSLDTIAREGIAFEVIPTEALRPLVGFALDYYFANGRAKAPSVAAIRADEKYANALDDAEIDIEVDPDDSVEWAIDDLKATFVYRQVGTFNKNFATAMADAEMADRIAVLSEHATELIRLSMSLESHQFLVDGREAMTERMLAYEAREADKGNIQGMTFGLPEFDSYTFGIHPGELAILAAPPKTGKSYFLDWVFLKEWQRGRSPVLFTLENSVEMTLDRIACLATKVPSGAWQHGECTAEQIDLVRSWIDQNVINAERPFWVIQPEPGKRSVEAMVRQAQVLDGDSLLIDQLTFIEWTSDPRRPRHERIGDGLHTLKALISATRDRLPCLLAHQINREGVKAAKKLGYLEMEHLAESAEVERTADWVFGAFASHDEKVRGLLKLQTLAARRENEKHFEMAWNVDLADIRITRPLSTLGNE